jgi:hypothetical protein
MLAASWNTLNVCHDQSRRLTLPPITSGLPRADILSRNPTGCKRFRSKTDLVNPPLEQGHGKAFTIARRYRFLFMA